MISDQVMQVIDSLLLKSRKKQVSWKKFETTGFGEPSPEDFVVSMPNYSINIYRYTNGESLGFAILDQYGNQTLQENALPDEKGFVQLRELLDLAKRKTSNVDDVLQDLNKVVSSDDVFGLGDEKTDDSTVPF